MDTPFSLPADYTPPTQRRTRMQSRDFCYWLQGFFEITGYAPGTAMSGDQVDMVKKHLALVFAHEIDPAMGDKPHQTTLNSIHGQGPGQFLARC